MWVPVWALMDHRLTVFESPSSVWLVKTCSGGPSPGHTIEAALMGWVMSRISMLVPFPPETPAR
jgi:hypothetical protein